MAKSTTFRESNESISKNTSSLTIDIWFSAQNTTTWFGSAVLYCTCNGVTKNTNVSHPKGGAVSASFTFDNIEHNEDGTKSVSWSWSCATGTSALGTQSDSGTKTLTQIARQATLKSAPNFNDEENPTIIYSNPAGESVDSVQACIADPEGNTIYVAYRELPKTGTAYTFELTDEERAKLIEAIPVNHDQVYVGFYIKTIINGEALTPFKHLTRILSVVNTEPDLAITIKDVGNASTQLTGDGTIFIKGFNYVTAQMTPTPKKGAKIVKQSITNGKQVISDEDESSISGIFENIEDDKFIFSVTDSFGHVTSKEVSVVMVPYIKPTCNIIASSPTADTGDMVVKISGSYFNNTFGAVDNILKVYWRSKKNNEEFGNWIEVDVTTTTDSYSVEFPLTGQEYQSTYTFQAKVEDSIFPEILSKAKIVKSIPVFNWGENNFDINVPLLVDGDLTVTGTINGSSGGSVEDSKNKFDGVLEYGGYDSNTGFKQDTLDPQYRNANIVEIEPNTAYTVSVNGTPQKYVFLYYDENRVFISEDRTNTTGIITTPENARYLNFRTFAADYTEDYANLVVQIEKGEVVTDYEPHKKYGYTMKDIVDIIYPVGSVYMSANDVDPAVIFGGVWEKIQNKFLLSSGDSYANGSTGGNTLHAHGVSSAYVLANASGNQFRFVEKTVPGWYSNGYRNFASTAVSDAWQYYGWALGGSTDNGSSMPPYLVVNMWKRTA